MHFQRLNGGKDLDLYELYQHRASVDEEKTGKKCICLISFQKFDKIFSYTITLA